METPRVAATAFVAMFLVIALHFAQTLQPESPAAGVALAQENIANGGE